MPDMSISAVCSSFTRQNHITFSIYTFGMCQIYQVFFLYYSTECTTRLF